MRYDPKLDGIRAFSALAVLLYHSHVPGFHGGFIGVDVFFVLSGFLITQVLSVNPNLPRFYWRRTKRLVPPLAFMLLGYLLIFPPLFPGYPHLRDASLSFLYLSDYSVAFHGFPKYILHTWSLSVEEHFYLLWPVIFLMFKPPVRVLVATYVIATFWRWGCAPAGWIETYARFDTRASGLILGCILAQMRVPKISALPGMIGLACGCLILRIGIDALSFGIMLAELCAAVLIIGEKPNWLGSAPLAYFGKLSYGIYLWHYLVIKICNDLHQPWYFTAPLSLALSVALAAVSYHGVEVWFRRHQQKPLPAMLDHVTVSERASPL